jgi:predicted amidohydrolase YtcJ
MSQTADLIIRRAQVFTADPAQPEAEAVAIAGRRIVYVGSNEAIEPWRSRTTRVIDAAGRTLLPGFIDSHFHLLSGSLEMGDIQVGSVRSFEQLRQTIREFAGQQPNDSWLVGRGLSYAILPAGQSLTRRHLDEISSDRPLILFAYDVHTAWANTEALRRAGLLQNGRTVAPNSEIVLGPDGLANGELRESGAYQPILDLVGEPDEARQKQLLKQGLAQAAELGLTSVHNMDGDAGQLALYAALEQAGELSLRVYVPFDVKPGTPPEALAEAAEMRRMYQSDMVRGGCVKFFMDGVIETYTGLLTGDYAGRPGNRGGALFSAAHFNRMATAADRLGLQIFVHATGDGAVRRALDGFEAAQQANGRRDSRHRVEHVELIHPDDVSRFAELGVIASMQPAHCPPPDGSDPWTARVGQTRWACSFAWQTLRDAGARLVFGSDWPVATQNPFAGLQAALNRQPWAPGLPDQRQSLTNALLSYTRDAAYAEFQEHQKGQLRPGMLADLVLLSEDIFSLPAAAIGRVRPVLTVCDGQIVYEA